jgi:hypothetical protein
MPMKHWLALASVVVTLGAGASVANARATRTGTQGDLSPTATNGRESGHYRMFEVSGPRGTWDRVQARARRLPVGRTTRAARPAFHLFLVKSDGTATDFGALRVNRIGNAAFLFDSRRMAFPAGVTTITDYSGGTIEVRDSSDTAVLSATLASF